jgi:phosphatidylinositol kinase/protein kinase (PI-3  family)
VYIVILYTFHTLDSPGFNMNFESAPFKLTREYVDLLGGLQSPLYAMFEELFVKGFTLLQQHVEDIGSLIQVVLFSFTTIN